MDLKKFKTNQQSEQEGVWVPLDKGTKVLIARTGNPRYKEYLRNKLSPYRLQLKTNSMDEEVAQRIIIETLAKTILLDWEGIQENGETIPYNYANAVDILTKYKDFRELISTTAEEMDLFKDEEEKEVVKN